MLMCQNVKMIDCTGAHLPSEKYPRLFFIPFSRISSGVLNGWFNATICIEKPNTKIANTTKNRPKSFIKSPMMIAHGPNKWWNDKKSKIWTHASKNDRAKHWLRQYNSVGHHSYWKKDIATSNKDKEIVCLKRCSFDGDKDVFKVCCDHLPTWTPTPAIPNRSTSNLMKPKPDLSLGLVNSNSSKPDNITNKPHSYQYGNKLGRTTG